MCVCVCVQYVCVCWYPRSHLSLSDLQEELAHVKGLLAECEESCAAEAARRREATAQVVRLTELKALLQHAVDGGGATVAEKQVSATSPRHVTSVVMYADARNTSRHSDTIPGAFCVNPGFLRAKPIH